LEGCGLLSLDIDMQHHVLGSGREPTFLGVKELLEVVHALCVEIEQLEGHAHRVAGTQFPQVADVRLGRERRMPALL